MKFTSKRGRPATGNAKLTIIEGGKQDKAKDLPSPKPRMNREPIDIYHEKGLISDMQHWAAIHFRWLYTLRFGAPGISATDYDRYSGGHSARNNDPKWQEEREREYAMTIEKLRKCGALKIVLNIAVFGHFPRHMPIGRISRKDYMRYNLNEVLKLREGLDVLAQHWGKDVEKH